MFATFTIYPGIRQSNKSSVQKHWAQILSKKNMTHLDGRQDVSYFQKWFTSSNRHGCCAQR